MFSRWIEKYFPKESEFDRGFAVAMQLHREGATADQLQKQHDDCAYGDQYDAGFNRAISRIRNEDFLNKGAFRIVR